MTDLKLKLKISKYWACSEIRSRVLRSATVRLFYHKTNGTVALRSTVFYDIEAVVIL